MRKILFLIQKEFIQIIRDPLVGRAVIMLPIVQLFLLAFAANNEVKNIRFDVIDQNKSVESQQMIHKLDASVYFELYETPEAMTLAYDDLKRDDIDIIIEIPPNFDTDLVREGKSTLNLTVNAINGVKAGVSVQYALQIIGNFNQEIRTKLLQLSPKTQQISQFELVTNEWYNKNQNFKNFFVPGILAVLVTIIGMFLASVNIVREKEVGTIEQINVTPIKKSEFIVGKLFPFWIIGLFDLGIGLLFSKLIFNIPMVGNLGVVFGFASLFLLVVLGIGLVISTISETQQQAMFIAWFFTVIFILIGGLFTPIESMPSWAQTITYFNPVRYMVELMRLVLLKGSSLADLSTHFIVIVVMAIVINSLAVWNYQKRS